MKCRAVNPHKTVKQPLDFGVKYIFRSGLSKLLFF